MDKLKAMQAFCEIVDAGSIAAAAKKADVVPSALSKALAALERELGFALLVRSTRRLGLTQEGRQYYATCRRMLAELEDTEFFMREARQHLRGVLRVGLHPSFVVLLRSLAGLHALAPSLRIETQLTNSVATMIEEGLDICLHVGEIPDCQLFATHLHDAHTLTCASPEYLRQHGEPRVPAELAQHRAVTYHRPDEQPLLRWEFIDGEHSETAQIPTAVVLRDGVGLIDAVIGGLGIARPIAQSVAPAIAAGAVVPILQRWRSPRYPMHALTVQPPSRLPTKTRLFLEQVKRCFATQG